MTSRALVALLLAAGCSAQTDALLKKPGDPPMAATPRPAAPAARLLGELEGRSLKPPQQEALQSAKNFLDQARTALSQRDYPRAANLASKARALTDDLAATSKQ